MTSVYTRRHFSSSEVQALYGNGNGDGVNNPAPLHFTITGSESPTNFTAVGLPSGLSVNARTGKITGITTDVGEHNVTIKAGNFLGFSPEQTLKINVKPIPPALSQNPDDLFASNVLGTSASVNFKIDDTGGQDANVTVYYDSSDGANPPGLGWWASHLTGDSDSGVVSSYTYTCAVNVRGSAKTVNGVTFAGELVHQERTGASHLDLPPSCF